MNTKPTQQKTAVVSKQEKALEKSSAYENVTPVIDMLLAFNNDYEALERLSEEAEKVLGEDWRAYIYEAVSDRDEKTKQAVSEKMEEVSELENALLTWEEANNILSCSDIDVNEINEKLPSFEYWLPYYYGEEGESLYQQIVELCSSHEQYEDSSSEDYDEWYDEDYDDSIEEHEEKPNLEEGIDKELLWSLNNFIVLKDYYDHTISRISARCIHLGGIAIDQYPQFGYVLDLLKEIIEVGDVVLNAPELEKLVEIKIENGKVGLEKLMADFKKELDDGAEPTGTPSLLKSKDKKDFISNLGGFADDDEAPVVNVVKKKVLRKRVIEKRANPVKTKKVIKKVIKKVASSGKISAVKSSAKTIPAKKTT